MIAVGAGAAAFDNDGSAEADFAVEIDDVAGRHADAAVGGRAAEFVFFWGAVDVDHAAVGVAVIGFEAAELHDASDDGVAAWLVGTDDFASGAAAFEDAAEGCVVADFFDDLHFPDRGAVAAWAVA